MNITNSVQTPNFQAMHMSKKPFLHKGLSKNDFLQNPHIKNCADKYEVLVNIKKLDLENPKRIDAFTTFVMSSAFSAVGTVIGLFLSFSSAGMLVGAIAGAGLGGAISYLCNNNHEYEYTLQAGHKIQHNVLKGALSEKYYVRNMANVMDIPNLSNTIEEQNKENFIEKLDRYDINELYEPKKMLEILNKPEIKEYYYRGECFNYPVDYDGNTLLTIFFDITPNGENKNDYNKILNIIKNMKNINFDQKDGFGVSIAEKVLNSENFETLELLKNKKITYSPMLKTAYDNIMNPEFKQRVNSILNLEEK